MQEFLETFFATASHSDKDSFDPDHSPPAHLRNWIASCSAYSLACETIIRLVRRTKKAGQQMMLTCFLTVLCLLDPKIVTVPSTGADLSERGSANQVRRPRCQLDGSGCGRCIPLLALRLRLCVGMAS